MTRHWQVVMVLGVCVGVASCARAQTRIVEMPRVDQELGGNRGYVQGNAPQSQAARKTTRQVIMTDVELMTGPEVAQRWRRTWKPAKGEVSPSGRYVAPENAPAQVSAAPTTAPAKVASTPALPSIPPPAETFEEPAPFEAPLIEPPSAEPTTYTVQKGDTLQKIAKKFYGTTKRWPRIYKANQTALKNPNRLYPGQALTIPSEDAESIQRASEEETIK